MTSSQLSLFWGNFWAVAAITLVCFVVGELTSLPVLRTKVGWTLFDRGRRQRCAAVRPASGVICVSVRRNAARRFAAASRRGLRCPA